MTTASLTIVIIAVIIVAAAIWYLLWQQRSKRLCSRFGEEYDHAIRQFGSRNKAEEALVARQKRMEKFHIRSLSAGERGRFAEEWHDVQARFVDDPAGSIDEADRVVCDVMKARGYPMSDFEHRAEDLSVDHPHVVRNFRLAHQIALRHQEGQASTEELRRALVCYRDLFDELLEAQPTVPGR